MNKEELILEIIEKVHEQGQITARKVDELQIEQVRQGEMHRINTEHLKEHMARTEANEERIILVEKHVQFVNSLIKIVTALGAIALFAVKVLPFLWNLV